MKPKVEKMRSIDEKIAKISEKYYSPEQTRKGPLILKSSNVLWRTLIDLFAVMIVGTVLGHMLDKRFESGNLCLTACLVLASLECIKKIVNTR